METVELHDLSINQIMEVRGVDQRTAYSIRKEATAEVNSSGASESLKAKILAVVRSQGPMNDLEDIRYAISPTTATMRDISAAVWALQKQDLVTFYERKHGRDSVITKIKIPRGTVNHAAHASARGRHPAGRDMTDPRNHGPQAEGGEIERSRMQVAKPKPRYGHVSNEKVIPALCYINENVLVRVVDVAKGLGLSSGRATIIIQRAEALGWIERRVASPSRTYLLITALGEQAIDEQNAAAPAKAPEVMEVPISDTHTQYPSDIGLPADMTPDAAYIAGFSDGEKRDLADFPLIAAVLSKTEKFARYEAAAALLLDDEPAIANALLDSIQLTDLEKEIIRFVGSK